MRSLGISILLLALAACTVPSNTTPRLEYSLARITDGVSRAVTWENKAGRAGAGGMSASNLGVGRKGSPCIRSIPPGTTVILMDVEGAGVFADRIRARVEEKMPVTVSGGVTGVRESDTAESILARADEALYAAKSAGRNCVCLYDGQNIRPLVAKKSEEEDLLAAV